MVWMGMGNQNAPQPGLCFCQGLIDSLHLPGGIYNHRLPTDGIDYQVIEVFDGLRICFQHDDLRTGAVVPISVAHVITEEWQRLLSQRKRYFLLWECYRKILIIAGNG